MSQKSKTNDRMLAHCSSVRSFGPLWAIGLMTGVDNFYIRGIAQTQGLTTSHRLTHKVEFSKESYIGSGVL